MNHSTGFPTPLQNVFWASSNSSLKQASIMLAAVILLAVSAHLSIPLTPVPLTFQSATVVLIGMLFGSKRGAGVVTAYLVAGAAGLPVFASVATPLTIGYLLSFLPAAYLAGFLAERGFAKSIIGSFFVACLSAAVIFAGGVSILATFIGWHEAVIVGFLPFIVTEPIKLLAAACVTPTCWK